MKKPLCIGTSNLTGNICCGSISKDGISWLDDKTEVTIQACIAVVKHLQITGNQFICDIPGKGRYRLIVEKIEPDIYSEDEASARNEENYLKNC